MENLSEQQIYDLFYQSIEGTLLENLIEAGWDLKEAEEFHFQVQHECQKRGIQW